MLLIKDPNSIGWSVTFGPETAQLFKPHSIKRQNPKTICKGFKKFDAKDLKSFKIKLTSMALGYSNFMPCTTGNNLKYCKQIY